MKPAIFAILALVVSSSWAEKIQVAVTVLPHAGLVEQVGGELVDVTVLIDRGQDPHSFSPSPRRASKVSKADVWFTAGMPFEEQLLKLSRGNQVPVVNLSEGLDLRKTDDHGHDHDHHDHDHHDHADEHEAHDKHHDHAHGEFDPHSWFSALHLRAQLRVIARKLGELSPEYAADFEFNADGYAEEVQASHLALAKQLAPFKGAKFYVFHSAFGYFADTYGLEEIAIEAGGREPTAKELTELIRQAKEDQVKVILVQPQFAKGSAKKIAKAIGAKTVSVDPLSKDVLKTLNLLADAIAEPR